MILTIDGAATFAATGGRPFDAAVPAVVFLHGAGMDHTVWAQQARYFAYHGRSVLALDLPGHGRSAGSIRGSVPALADWVAQALDAAGLARAALVGHSMGALIALEAAARMPGRVRSLALLGIAGRMPVHPDLQAAAAAGQKLAPELMVAWGHGRSGQIGGHPSPGLWMMGSALSLIDRSREGVLAADLAACNAYDGALAAAARVDCPTLFLVGAADRMTPPSHAKALSEAIGAARTVVLPDTGHMLMTERPDAVIDALKEIV